MYFVEKNLHFTLKNDAFIEKNGFHRKIILKIRPIRCEHL